MIAVSDEWKVKQTDRLVPEGFVEIRYWLTDPGVQREAVATDNEHAYFSKTTQVTSIADKEDPLYATTERNLWVLDGSMELVSDSTYGDTGYVSGALSNGSGSFDTIQTITLSFESVHENVLPGMSIVWSDRYDEYATRFRIRAYQGSTLLNERLVENNDTVESLVEMDISGYDRITVEVLAWCLPYRRARCKEIRLGMVQTIHKEELLGFEHTQSVDLLSGALPKNAVTFRLANVDGRWNPENPTGMEQYLLERQELTVRYGIDIDGTIEWIKAGTFYVSEWQTPSNGLEAIFTARDLIEFLNDVYTGPRVGSLYSIAEAAIQQANLPLDASGSVRYRIDSSLANYSTDLTADDTEYTIAEILQLAANAACCVMYQNRSGILCIEPLRTTYSGYAVTQHISYSHPEYIISKELKAVDVNEGLKVIENAPSGEVQTVRNPLIQLEQQADMVGGWIAQYLKSRKMISGTFRADPRLDALDTIAVESKYGLNNAVILTDLTYTFSGAFHGKYIGRVVEFPPDYPFAGELHAGEWR